MRSRSIALLTVLFLAGGLATAEAGRRPRPAERNRKSSFEANKTFGLGLMVGAPTGLTGKYFISSDKAIDFGLGTIYGYRERRGLHLHADFLWHPASLVSAPAFEMPFYVGVGGRYFDGNRCYHYDPNGFCDVRYYDYSALGVRVPLGISFDMNNTPLDIFVELAFVLDFLVDHDPLYDDSMYFDINGAAGLRYYFN